MKKIKIITDTTSDLPKEVINKYDIDVMPLMINFGEESYLDGIDITRDEVFKRIEEGDVFPSTAQITPNRFEEEFRKYLDDGYVVIAILMSSVMSGTYQSACIAKDMIESDDIHIVDSKLVCASLGLLVIKAAKLVQQNLEPLKIVEELENTKNKIDCSLSFDSLDNLVKGGRISKTVGVVTGILGIKLIVYINEGIMAVKDKVRGSKKAIKRLLSDVEEADLDESMPVIIVNVHMDEIVEQLKNHMIDNNIDYIESTVGSTVGIHSGDKAAGVFFVNK